MLGVPPAAGARRSPEPDGHGAGRGGCRDGTGERRGRRLTCRRLLAAASLAGLTALTLGGCERGSGYIEIKLVPSAGVRSPRLLLDSTRLEPIRDGQAILTARAGIHKLQMEWIGGQNTVLCQIEVRKDRITTLTLSVLNRPPRCQCRRSSPDSKGRTRTCIS